MNCKQAREHWNLFYDSEGDAELFLKVNEHLEECSDCADWFEVEGSLERTIQNSLREDNSDSALWTEILQKANITPERSAFHFNWSKPLLLAICLLVLLAVWRIMDSPSSETQPGTLKLANLAAELHESFISGKQDVEFFSHSALEVEGYLHRKVSFPVRCPPREDVGFFVDGAGTVPFGPNRAAYLVGKVRGEPVSIFILPKDAIRHFDLSKSFHVRYKPHSLSRGEFELILSTFDKNIVVVVGKGKSLPLEKVIDAYGTYPEHDRG